MTSKIIVPNIAGEGEVVEASAARSVGQGAVIALLKFGSKEVDIIAPATGKLAWIINKNDIAFGGALIGYIKADTALSAEMFDIPRYRIEDASGEAAKSAGFIADRFSRCLSMIADMSSCSTLEALETNVGEFESSFVEVMEALSAYQSIRRSAEVSLYEAVQGFDPIITQMQDIIRQFNAPRWAEMVREGTALATFRPTTPSERREFALANKKRFAALDHEERTSFDRFEMSVRKFAATRRKELVLPPPPPVPAADQKQAVAEPKEVVKEPRHPPKGLLRGDDIIPHNRNNT
ncbi:hypothetical protein [Magnetospirillum sp. 15-1]|uniref:hypothetical protein n=1 Tax=Magnetospirillum sp. 15-1 TaxID=1979370 RepID=UPI000BBBC1C5|nr:hypothetical protein [Magnetospirillum sp. 15-1]